LLEFPSTSWSLILAASDGEHAGSVEALAQLCATYWYPLYAYARRLGYATDAACDCTQGYFTKLLEKRYLHDAHQERGRFRSFLLTSFRHYLSNERDHERAAKRGGGAPLLSIDMETAEGRYALEPREDLTPERLFERRWAILLLDGALSDVQRECENAGTSRFFHLAKAYLTGESGAAPYCEAAGELGISVGAFKVAVYRMRRRFREAVRKRIAATVEQPAQIEEELRFLFRAVA
jgi:DNA-directed RNA polymerase specialized sigma24 family protein